MNTPRHRPLFIVPLLLLALPTLAATPDCASELARCRSVEDSLERLRCYDDVADAGALAADVETDRFGRPLLPPDLVVLTDLEPDEKLAPFSGPVTLSVPLAKLEERAAKQLWTVPNSRRVEVAGTRIQSLSLEKTRKGVKLRFVLLADPGRDRDVYLTYTILRGDEKLAQGADEREVEEGRTKTVEDVLEAEDIRDGVWAELELRVTFDVELH